MSVNQTNRGFSLASSKAGDILLSLVIPLRQLTLMILYQTSMSSGNIPNLLLMPGVASSSTNINGPKIALGIVGDLESAGQQCTSRRWFAISSC